MSEIIGEQLRKTRQELDISLEQAAEETRIRLHYLEAMERGDFTKLPSKAHERGFLRAYAEYLGLDTESFLSDLDQQEEPALGKDISSPDEQVLGEKTLPTDSQVIFEALGEQLRGQRELLGFSINEVERNIHVREHYLVALEAGNIGGLPSPVQGRGMLQNYASFLSLDVEAILLKYADGLQAQLAEKRSMRPVESDTKQIRRSARFPLSGIFPGDWILRAVLILAVLAFIVWGVIRINAIQAALNPVETILPIADALQATQESDLTEIPLSTEVPVEEAIEPVDVPVEGGNPIPAATEEIGPETPVPTESDAPVQIYVSVLRRAWMRVIVDGEIEFEGRIIPGSAYSFSGDFQVELLTGNGAGLQVFFNGEDLGVLGVYGEVVYEVFTPEGVLLPTPTNTPVPTNTSEPPSATEVP
jgi:cytoskeletal protein RodZ